jgi:hypothetical protein
MTMAFYRKKPVVVEAKQYTDNLDEIASWLRQHGQEIVSVSLPEYQPIQEGAQQTMVVGYKDSPAIRTLEGDMLLNKNDFVIKGLKGEFYPCKPDIFANSYDLA